LTTRLISSGVRVHKASSDPEGYRTYHVTYLVQGDVGDGPVEVFNTPGLPVPGDSYAFNSGSDQWAFCTQEWSISGQQQEGPITFWDVEIKFTSKPDEKRCKDQKIEDPLLIPDRVSGGFHKYTEEATSDRFGRPIVNSAWEQLRGPQAEFDKHRASIKIEQNVIDLQLGLISSVANCVNGSTMWGLPPRTIKLDEVSFEVKYYGNCFKYYTRTLGFDILFDGFDRDVLDEGTKALNGAWTTDGTWKLINVGGQPPNPTNPAHFSQFKDRKDENAKCILDGRGLPYSPNPVLTKLCTTCPDGSPTSWTAVGYIPPTPTTAGSVVSFTLTYASDCRWTGTYNSKVIDLSFAGTNPAPAFWTMSYSVGPIYWLNSGDYNCITQSTLTYDNLLSGALTSDMPASWTLYPTVTSQPGNIHIERYQEADFFVLDIPTSI
jgi:hypothetical protein